MFNTGLLHVYVHACKTIITAMIQSMYIIIVEIYQQLNPVWKSCTPLETASLFLARTSSLVAFVTWWTMS